MGMIGGGCYRRETGIKGGAIGRRGRRCAHSGQSLSISRGSISISRARARAKSHLGADTELGDDTFNVLDPNVLVGARVCTEDEATCRRSNNERVRAVALTLLSCETIEEGTV